MLNDGALIGGRLLIAYLVDASTEIRRFERDGTPDGTVALPGIGTAGGLSGSPVRDEAFFIFTSYNTPVTIYRYDVGARTLTPWAEPRLTLDPASLVEEQRFFSSRDGTRVPLFVVRRRDLTGPVPTLLYGYGGFGISLLVGAVTNQRPDLFDAALPGSGVMDMLRYDQFTGASLWHSESGQPSAPAHVANLLSYSPYRNVRSGRDYPAILVTTADADDRVVPAHSFKYVAALQSADIGARPRLVRIDTRAAHGAGMPLDKIIAHHADMWGFAARWTGLAIADGGPTDDGPLGRKEGDDGEGRREVRGEGRGEECSE